MSGDWIKMRVDLYGDPAVKGMARATGLDRYAVIGRLHTVWSWADQHLRNGNAVGVTAADLDDEVQHPGFAQAMVDVKWLQILSTGLSFPDFEKHNGKPAKVRALTLRRVKRHRDGTSVTPPLPEKRRSSSTQAATRTQTVEDPPPPAAADAGTPTPTPAPDLAAEIIVEARKVKIEVDEPLAEAWSKGATIGQVRKALEISRSHSRKPLPEPCPASYVTPILREIVAEERKARRAADRRVDATQAEIAKQREDAKSAAPMPEALKPRKRRAQSQRDHLVASEDPVTPTRAREPEALPSWWAVMYSVQLRVMDVQPTWDSDHIEHMARQFRDVAKHAPPALDWDEVFVAWCARMDPLVAREPTNAEIERARTIADGGEFPVPALSSEPPTSDAGEELAIDDSHWWEDPERVMARAVELNVAIFDGENFGDFTARVLAELGPGPHLQEIVDETLLEKINYFQRVGPTSDAARPQPA